MFSDEKMFFQCFPLQTCRHTGYGWTPAQDCFRYTSFSINWHKNTQSEQIHLLCGCLCVGGCVCSSYESSWIFDQLWQQSPCMVLMYDSRANNTCTNSQLQPPPSLHSSETNAHTDCPSTEGFNQTNLWLTSHKWRSAHFCLFVCFVCLCVCFKAAYREETEFNDVQSILIDFAGKIKMN